MPVTLCSPSSLSFQGDRVFACTDAFFPHVGTPGSYAEYCSVAEGQLAAVPQVRAPQGAAAALPARGSSLSSCDNRGSRGGKA